MQLFINYDSDSPISQAIIIIAITSESFSFYRCNETVANEDLSVSISCLLSKEEVVVHLFVLHLQTYT